MTKRTALLKPCPPTDTEVGEVYRGRTFPRDRGQGSAERFRHDKDDRGRVVLPRKEYTVREKMYEIWIREETKGCYI